MASPHPDGRGAPVARYPWESLDSMSRSELASMRSLRRWGAHYVRLDLIERSMAALLGADVAIRMRRARPLAGARAARSTFAVLLSPAEAPASHHGVLVEADDALAATIVARAIRRSPPAVPVTGSSGRAPMAGAIAAVLAAVARRAHAQAPLRVDAAGEASALEAELLQMHPGAVAVNLTVVVGDDAFTARVAMSAERAGPVPSPTWDRDALSRLGATPLSMPVVACAARSTVIDVGGLRRGDLFLPGTWPLTGHPGALSGAVLLSPASSDTGIRARLGDGGQLVLGGELEPLLAAEGDMPDIEEKGALLTALGDVPVVVRVEVGEACMAARDWASLGRGDVVTLGRRVGEHVLLRVGGLPVARGDLVEVDGEVGVRIVERLDGGRTAA